MKKIVLWLLCCVVLLSGCTQSENSQPSEMDAWLEAAALDAEETPAELYEKAKSEDILTIYTVSTRMMDVAKSFEQQYPGLTVKVYDLRADELIDKVKQNAANGTYDCDIIFCTDVDGSLSQDLVPNKLAFKYTPYDIADKMLPGFDDALLSVLCEINLIAYNGALHDTSPISNWWELTEPQWHGRVQTTNAAKSMTTLSAFMMVQKHEEQLEQAYFDLYGVEFASQNGEGAGKTFIRKLFENGLIVNNSSDETAEAIGAPGNAEDNLGIIVSSKMRLKNIGYTLENSYQTKPFIGFTNPVNIMITGGAKNVNTAKLFIRWILGEADGQGVGYQPYLQNGAWSTRKDVQSQSPFALDELNVIYTDSAYIYNNRDDFTAFWEELLSKAK